MTRRYFRTLPFVFSAACVAPESPDLSDSASSGEAASNSGTELSDADQAAVDELASTPAERAGLAGLIREVRATESAFHWGAKGYAATQPLVGMELTFSAAGPVVATREASFSLRTVSVGREEMGSPVGATDPFLGACADETRPSLDGDCVQRLEYARDGHTEWWASGAAQAQVGWELTENPGGTGFIEIGMRVDNGIIDAGIDDTSVLIQSGGRAFSFAGLKAWDAQGRSLETWIEFDEQSLRILVDDTGATWPISVDPVLTSWMWSAVGSDSTSLLGGSVAAAGDVNNDGYDDIIVGAPGYSSYSGRAYVYHGTYYGIDYSAATTMSGTGTYAYFGDDVNGAGDVNRDGYDDVIVGSYYYSSGIGRAEVHHGSSSGVSTTANWGVNGSTSYYLGKSVAGAGDVNNDGYDDVIVGAYGYGSSAGRVGVYHGSSTGLSTTQTTNIYGSSASNLGYSVDSAGDVNNDGYDDVIIGASYYSNGYGRAYVHYGSSAGISSSAARTLTGSYSGEYFGHCVRGLGSVNGDIYDDVAVGAPYYSTYTGRAVVYHGASTGIPATPASYLYGSATYQYFGYSLGAAGDVNADGYKDLLVGSIGTNSYTGQAEVFPGSSTGVSTADTVISGYTTSSYGGYSVSGAGDVNADGYDDVIVGNYYYSSGDGLALAYFGYVDADDDGYYLGGGYGDYDCDDTNYYINPGMAETVGDGVDQNCDGVETCYEDDDNDGYLDTSGDTRSSTTDVDCADTYEGANTDSATDCDDTDGADYPGASEIIGNGDDENCDGKETCYDDDDNDGYLDSTGDTRTSADTDCADASEGTSSDLTTDCDDTDIGDNPAAAEIVGNGDDENCDGTEVCYTDLDDDFYATATTRASTDKDCFDLGEGTADELAAGVDCNDSSSGINAGAAETVGDEIDADCNGSENCYTDIDGDGYAVATIWTSTDTDCRDESEATAATYALGLDCDDNAIQRSPALPEVCDESDVDEDCDGLVDDLDASVSAASYLVWYLDNDGDGFGDPANRISRCAQPTKYVDNASDCDDSSPAIHPAAAEVVGAGGDEDCDGLSACYQDQDRDGYATGTVVQSPGTDCTGVGEATAAQFAAGVDCDDADGAVNPGAIEVCDPSDVDEDCDTLADDQDTSTSTASKVAFYTDADADMYGDGASVAEACNPPTGTSAQGGDCADADPTINPGATERIGDEFDQNCDAVESCYADSDWDGWATEATVISDDLDCADPGEATAAIYANGWDCDDTVFAANPAGVETCDDHDVDEDCNGLSDDMDAFVVGTTAGYVDGDADGFGDASTEVVACEHSPAEVFVAGDCDDEDVDVNPGESEVCDRRDSDEDCDGLVNLDDDSLDPSTTVTGYSDGDGDGYGTNESARISCELAPEQVALGADCDDTDAAYYPGAPEPECTDPNDYNCDGSAGSVDSDEDGYVACEECDDGSASVNPRASEVCNGVDDDCDGVTDGGTATDATVWYPDADGDGYGARGGVTDCDAPEGYLAESGDCVDTNPDINPGVAEICDGTDQNCDGTTDEGACGGPDDTGDTATADDDTGGGKNEGELAGPPEGCGCATQSPGAGAAGLIAAAVAGLATRRRATIGK